MQGKLRGAIPGTFRRPLSRRQAQIVDLICEGCSHKEIAARLGITEGTVKIYVSSCILRKLDCRSTLEVAVKVLGARLQAVYAMLPGPEGAD